MKEATVITIHGRQVCRLVDPAKVKIVTDELSPYWNKQLMDLDKTYRPEKTEIL